MPNRQKINHIISKDAHDLSKIRLPGLNKPLDQMTIGELTQLKPTAAADQDCNEVNAVTDNASYTSSCLLNQLSRMTGEAAVRREIAARKLRGIEGPEIVDRLPGT